MISTEIASTLLQLLLLMIMATGFAFFAGLAIGVIIWGPSFRRDQRKDDRK